MAKSPVAVIYGNNGSSYIETTIRGGIAVPAGQPGILGLGSDGTNTRYITVDSSGRTVIVGPQSNGSAVTGNPVLIGGSDGTNVRNIRTATDGTVRVDPTGSTTQPISATTLPLPTGAATETTLGGVLTTTAFQARINTLGQKTMANSTPVVLASDQSAIAISGTITANIGTAGTLALEATQVKTTIAPGTALGSNTLTMVGGSVTTAAPTYTTGQINPLSITTAGGLRVDLAGTTVPLPTGAATETTLGGVLTTSAFQARINTLGQKAMAASTPVVISSDQSAIPASQSGTWNIANITGTVSLPTGAATETTLSAINGKLNSLGQKAMTGSVPVVIASDQTSFPVTSTQLPAALVGGRLDTNNGAWLGSTAPTVGQKTMTNSIPVVISSDQAAIPVSQSGTWNIANITGTISLPTGAATSALQTTGNTSLSNIDTKTPSLGQALMAASTPVVIASNQSNVPVNLTQVGGTGVVTGGVGGSQGVGGLAAHGSPSSGNPVLMGVVDTPAGNVYRMVGDSVGRQIVVGAAPSGSAVIGNPVLVGGTDGTNAFSAQMRSNDILEGIVGLIVRNSPARRPTFVASAQGIALGNNKSMLGVLLTGTSKLKLRKVYIKNVQTTAVTGVATIFQLRRITSLTGGTAVTPVAMDTTDTALSGVTCVTGGTPGGASIIDRWLWSSDEWGPGTLDVEAHDHGLQNTNPVWTVGVNDPERELTANQNQGWEILCATNTTAGTFDIVFVFTQG